MVREHLMSQGLAGTVVTVADLLTDDRAHLAVVLRRALARLGLAEVAAPRAGARSTVDVGTVGGVGTVDVVEQAAQALGSFLMMPVAELVFWAWAEQPAVQEACRRTSGRRGARQWVVVADHTLESVQRPYVELDVAGERTPILDVVLSLTLTVASVTVEVAQGQVVACGGGQASSVVDLALARPGGHLHRVLGHETPTFPLPVHRHSEAGPGTAGPRRTTKGVAVGGSAPVANAAGVGIPGARWYPDSKGGHPRGY
jgi:hypothetical protein